MPGPNAPRRVYAQQRRGHTVRFEFAADGLHYFETRDKASTSTVVPWAQIPSAFHFVTSSDAGYAMPALLAALLVGYGFVLLDRDSPLQSFGLVAACAMAFALILGRIVRTAPHVQTRINCKGARMTVFQGRDHDEIVYAITATRAAYYRRFTPVDPTHTKRKQLRNLRKLVELDVLSEDEFDLARARIMPYGPRRLLKAAPSGESKTFTQRTLFTRRTFTFREDHFEFMRSNFRCKVTQNIRYDDLKDLRSLNLGFERDPVTGVVAAWAMLAVVACGLYVETHPIAQVQWLDARLPQIKLTGLIQLTGLGHALAVYGPLFGLGVLIIWGHRRFAMHRHTGVARLFSILKDKKHDAILDELKARRVSTMRALAEVDPLLTVEEQKSVLNRLWSHGLLSERAAQDRLSLAMQLQTQLGLDEPSTPAQPKAAPAPAPAPEPASRPQPAPAAMSGRMEAIDWERRASLAAPPAALPRT